MAFLKRIKISGFKSIREMDLELKPLNIMIGANGAGKSNFISFLKMLGYLTTGSLQLFIGENGGADSLLYYGSKMTPQLSGTLEIETYKGLDLYYLKMAHAAGDTLIFTNESVAFTRKGFPEREPQPIGAGHKESVLGNYSDDKKNYLVKTAKIIKAILEKWNYYQFHDTSDTARIKQEGYIHDNRYIRSDAGNIAAYLYMLKSTLPNNYKRIVETIRLIAPFFDDFLLHPLKLNPDRIRLEWKEKNSDMLFNASQFSDGSLRAICLITVLLQPEPPELIIIDEPELGLHPYAVSVISSLMKSVSQKTQIIAATQSVNFVEQFEPEDIVVVDREEEQSVFKRIDSKELEDWLEDYTIGELWQKNVIGGRP